MTSIAYALEPDLKAAEFIDVLQRSGLAERRPVDDIARIETMLRRADLTVTARDPAGLLVGVARSITDFSYCCYLSDLAVDAAFQGRGIGKALMLRTRDEATGGQSYKTGDSRRLRCFLFAAPKARSYYPHVGLDALPDAWEFTALE